MQSSAELKEQLRSLNRKSYPAYKSLKGTYRFQKYILSIDHVQEIHLLPFPYNRLCLP